MVTRRIPVPKVAGSIPVPCRSITFGDHWKNYWLIRGIGLVWTEICPFEGEEHLQKAKNTFKLEFVFYINRLCVIQDWIATFCVA